MNLQDRLIRLIRRAVAPGVNRIATPQAVAYLQDVVAPRLGIPPMGDFRRVRAGANTAVVRWRTASGDVVYARIWPWKRQHHPVRQHREAAALLLAAGLHTPEILFSDDSTSLIAQWGVEVLVEREAAGGPLHHLADERPEVFVSLARDLARLHTREGPAWNKPWLPRGGAESPSNFWNERLARFRERITPKSTSLTADEIAASLDLLRRGLEVAARRPPRLVHGDVSPSHVFVDEAGRLMWIDLETVHYGAAEEDLAAVFRWLPPRLFPAFLDTYAAATGRPVDPAALRTFRLFLHWERLNSRVQQARRRSLRADEGRKNVDKLVRDRRASEEAIRRLLAGVEAPASD